MTKCGRLRKTWTTFDSTDIEGAIEFLKQELVLSDPVGDTGFSQRQHLEAVEKITGRKPPQLEDLLELPESMREVWIWFKRLSNRRQSGMGVNPISFTEMQAFFRLIGVMPLSEEVAVIEAFDNITTSHYAKKQATDLETAKQKRQ